MNHCFVVRVVRTSDVPGLRLGGCVMVCMGVAGLASSFWGCRYGFGDDPPCLVYFFGVVFLFGFVCEFNGDGLVFGRHGANRPRCPL
jgi:hypothetical protein